MLVSAVCSQGLCINVRIVKIIVGPLKNYYMPRALAMRLRMSSIVRLDSSVSVNNNPGGIIRAVSVLKYSPKDMPMPALAS